MPDFYIHDVLQSINFSCGERMIRQRGGDFFELFKDTIKLLDGCKTIVLLVLAEGIDTQPKWVEYIKQHPEWKIECHGWCHTNYLELVEKDYDFVVKQLKKSKKKIEETFNCKISMFVPPRAKCNEKLIKAAKEAGMKTDNHFFTIGRSYKGRFRCRRVHIHYWWEGDRKVGKKLFEWKKKFLEELKK